MLVTDKLSSALKNDFVFEMNYKIISKSKLFKCHFSDKLIYHASDLMNEMIIPPEEFLFQVL